MNEPGKRFKIWTGYLCLPYFLLCPLAVMSKENEWWTCPILFPSIDPVNRPLVSLMLLKDCRWSDGLAQGDAGILSATY